MEHPPPSASPSQPWEATLHAVTHILTSPTTSPPLYSQFFIARLIPCYLNWDYPPILCRRSPSLLRRWEFSRFLRKAWRLGLPETSWRCRCPYQQPPPLILAKGLEEARWGDEERRAYFRKRVMRKKVFSKIPPFLAVWVPNLVLILLFIWKPPGPLYK